MDRIPNSLPFSLQVVLSRYQDQVDHVDDERPTGDGYWVYLRPGWVYFTHLLAAYKAESAAKEML